MKTKSKTTTKAVYCSSPHVHLARASFILLLSECPLKKVSAEIGRVKVGATAYHL
jgi:hypothetical protein